MKKQTDQSAAGGDGLELKQGLCCLPWNRCFGTLIIGDARPRTQRYSSDFYHSVHNLVYWQLESIPEQQGNCRRTDSFVHEHARDKC